MFNIVRISKFATAVAVFSLVFGAGAAQANTWKSVFIAGDDSIANFDNGREDLAAMFSTLGTIDARHLTSSQQLTSGTVGLATQQGMRTAFASLDVQPNEGCLVHMTSHGIRNGGFYLSNDNPLLPKTLAKLVDDACGDQPTVVLVSACYSGQFIIDELKGDNRIIMTAAIADRPSFGCSPDTEYTYWDGCLLSEVPKSQTWNEVYTNVQQCIQTKEAAIGARPSLPQAFFGANTVNWSILE